MYFRLTQIHRNTKKSKSNIYRNANSKKWFTTIKKGNLSKGCFFALKEIVKNNSSENDGFIIRTAAKNKSDEEIINDIKNVEKTYKEIIEKAEKLKKEKDIIPKKIYDVGGIVNKVLLGFTDNIDKIVVNEKEVYNFIINEYENLKKKTKLKENENLISDNIFAQLEKIKNRKIWLNCGGFITIDKTEALTAIDVNTGKYIGKDTLEKTVLKVNEEATIEIAKQLRSRDIGGIVIVDYIDMEEKSDEAKIVELLEKELKKDRAKTQIVGFTPLHLLEMTRKHLCSN